MTARSKMKKTAKPKSRSRGKGRPQAEGNVVGREALIAATRELLKTRPSTKLNRLEIARYAGVDPGLIRYYFGTIETLFAEVAVRITAEVRAGIHADAGNKGPEALADRIQRTLRMFVENPYHHALVEEQIFAGTNPKARAEWRDIIGNSVAELEAVLRVGEREGWLRHVEPRYLHLLIIGACEFFVSGRTLVEDMFGGKASAGADPKNFAAFLIDVLTHGLKASR